MLDERKPSELGSALLSHFEPSDATECADDDRQRLHDGFQRCHTRPPTMQETRVLLSELTARRKQYTSDPESARQLLAVGESAVDSTIPDHELAAWTSVARVMMNLSEFVTKP